MQPGKIYHIYNHGNAEDDLFRVDDNYMYFLAKFRQHLSSAVNTYAFCLLPNHFHFLLQVVRNDLLTLPDFQELTIEKMEERVIKRFSNFFNAYTKAFNKMFRRKGKLFLLPFQRKHITSAAYFLNTWKYIHYNPVHHGFRKSPYEWPFSSIHDYGSADSAHLALAEAMQHAGVPLNFSTTSELEPTWSDLFDMNY